MTGVTDITASGNVTLSGALTGVTDITASGNVTLSGNLGIGTSSPGYKLDVNGTMGVSNNLNFSGTAQRITGDFSNATVANKVMFQTSTVNGSTIPGLIPNGTSTTSGVVGYAAADPANASYAFYGTYSDRMIMEAGRAGTGTYLPMTFYTSGSERMRIDTSGNLGIGVTPSAWVNGTKALQIRYSSFYADDNNGFTGIGFNTYASGTNTDTYQLSLAAAKYTVRAGTHNWYTAPSGTAGNPITFTQAMTLDTSGNLYLGAASGLSNVNGVSFNNVTNGWASFNHLNGTASGIAYAYFGYNGSAIGAITQSGTTAVLYNTTSDHRLKTNVQPLSGALAKVQALKPSEFDWVDGRHDDGFIAHELQAVLPNVVTGDKDAVNDDGTPKYQQVDYARIVPTLCAAIQEQQQIITDLKTRIEALEAK